VTDEPCATCGHPRRVHDPEDLNCETHADVGLGRCPCNRFMGLDAEVERLRAEVERLRAENRKLRDVLEWVNVQCPGKCAGVCDAALRGDHRREEES